MGLRLFRATGPSEEKNKKPNANEQERNPEREQAQKTPPSQQIVPPPTPPLTPVWGPPLFPQQPPVAHVTKETGIMTKQVNVDGIKMVNEYLILQTIGAGNYGKVKRAQSLSDGQQYAIKILNKSVLRRKRKGNVNALQNVMREIAIMKKLDHPNIVKLYEVIDDPNVNKIYLILELMEGTSQQEGRALDMPTIHRYLRDTVSGLAYLHSLGIIHRDIKPENLLRSVDDHLKLSDFGVSQVIQSEHELIAQTEGSPAFMAPEVCSAHGYEGPPVDVWALGVTLYAFVFGRFPFMAPTEVGIYRAIREDEVVFPWDIPDGLRDLFRRMLDKNPHLRISVKELLHHPWVTETGAYTLRYYQPSYGLLLPSPASTPLPTSVSVVSTMASASSGSTTPATTRQLPSAQSLVGAGPTIVTFAHAGTGSSNSALGSRNTIVVATTPQLPTARTPLSRRPSASDRREAALPSPAHSPVAHYSSEGTGTERIRDGANATRDVGCVPRPLFPDMPTPAAAPSLQNPPAAPGVDVSSAAPDSFNSTTSLLSPVVRRSVVARAGQQGEGISCEGAGAAGQHPEEFMMTVGESTAHLFGVNVVPSGAERPVLSTSLRDQQLLTPQRDGATIEEGALDTGSYQSDSSSPISGTRSYDLNHTFDISPQPDLARPPQRGSRLFRGAAAAASSPPASSSGGPGSALPSDADVAAASGLPSRRASAACAKEAQAPTVTSSSRDGGATSSGGGGGGDGEQHDEGSDTNADVADQRWAFRRPNPYLYMSSSDASSGDDRSDSVEETTTDEEDEEEEEEEDEEEAEALLVAASEGIHTDEAPTAGAAGLAAPVIGSDETDTATGNNKDDGGATNHADISSSRPSAAPVDGPAAISPATAAVWPDTHLGPRASATSPTEIGGQWPSAVSPHVTRTRVDPDTEFLAAAAAAVFAMARPSSAYAALRPRARPGAPPLHRCASGPLCRQAPGGMPVLSDAVSAPTVGEGTAGVIPVPQAPPASSGGTEGDAAIQAVTPEARSPPPAEGAAASAASGPASSVPTAAATPNILAVATGVAAGTSPAGLAAWSRAICPRCKLPIRSASPPVTGKLKKGAVRRTATSAEPRHRPMSASPARLPPPVRARERVFSPLSPCCSASSGVGVEVPSASPSLHPVRSASAAIAADVPGTTTGPNAPASSSAGSLPPVSPPERGTEGHSVAAAPAAAGPAESPVPLLLRRGHSFSVHEPTPPPPPPLPDPSSSPSLAASAHAPPGMAPEPSADNPPPPLSVPPPAEAAPGAPALLSANDATVSSTSPAPVPPATGVGATAPERPAPASGIHIRRRPSQSPSSGASFCSCSLGQRSVSVERAASRPSSSGNASAPASATPTAATASTSTVDTADAEPPTAPAPTSKKPPRRKGSRRAALALDGGDGAAASSVLSEKGITARRRKRSAKVLRPTSGTDLAALPAIEWADTRSPPLPVPEPPNGGLPPPSYVHTRHMRMPAPHPKRRSRAAQPSEMLAGPPPSGTSQGDASARPSAIPDRTQTSASAAPDASGVAGTQISPAAAPPSPNSPYVCGESPYAPATFLLFSAGDMRPTGATALETSPPIPAATPEIREGPPRPRRPKVVRGGARQQQARGLANSGSGSGGIGDVSPSLSDERPQGASADTSPGASNGARGAPSDGKTGQQRVSPPSPSPSSQHSSSPVRIIGDPRGTAANGVANGAATSARRGRSTGTPVSTPDPATASTPLLPPLMTGVSSSASLFGCSPAYPVQNNYLSATAAAAAGQTPINFMVTLFGLQQQQQQQQLQLQQQQQQAHRAHALPGSKYVLPPSGSPSRGEPTSSSVTSPSSAAFVAPTVSASAASCSTPPAFMHSPAPFSSWFPFSSVSTGVAPTSEVQRESAAVEPSASSRQPSPRVPSQPLPQSSLTTGSNAPSTSTPTSAIPSLPMAPPPPTSPTPSSPSSAAGTPVPKGSATSTAPTLTSATSPALAGTPIIRAPTVSTTNRGVSSGPGRPSAFTAPASSPATPPVTARAQPPTPISAPPTHRTGTGNSGRTNGAGRAGQGQAAPPSWAPAPYMPSSIFAEAVPASPVFVAPVTRPRGSSRATQPIAIPRPPVSTTGPCGTIGAATPGLSCTDQGETPITSYALPPPLPTEAAPSIDLAMAGGTVEIEGEDYIWDDEADPSGRPHIGRAVAFSQGSLANLVPQP